MKSVKKMEEELTPNIMDIGECNLHKVYSAFISTGLSATGSDVELLVIDIYHFFTQAVRS